MSPETEATAASVKLSVERANERTLPIGTSTRLSRSTGEPLPFSLNSFAESIRSFVFATKKPKSHQLKVNNIQTEHTTTIVFN